MTSAAVVMIAVFSVFATLPLLEFKQLGVGLAAAIALDATIVRGLALPAVVTLLGDRGLAPSSRSRIRARARAGIMVSVSQRSDRAMTDTARIDCGRCCGGRRSSPSLVLLPR